MYTPCGTLHRDITGCPQEFFRKPWIKKFLHGRDQTDCKPGSVVLGPYRRGRWPFIWDARYRAPRAINPGGEVRKRTLQGMPPLLDLAPGGVCRATSVAGSAVRSCRTLSPLPPVWWPEAVCFLWHFPWGCPRRVLPGTMFPWSPDFPPFPYPRDRGPWGTAAIRPSDPWNHQIVCRRLAVNARAPAAGQVGHVFRRRPRRRPLPGGSASGRPSRRSSLSCRSGHRP